MPVFSVAAEAKSTSGRVAGFLLTSRTYLGLPSPARQAVIVWEDLQGEFVDPPAVRLAAHRCGRRGHASH